MCNFLVRFSYEFFLEICLSALIHVTSMKLLQTDVEAEVSIASWILAALYLLAILAFVGFVLSRFCFNGPYIARSY